MSNDRTEAAVRRLWAAIDARQEELTSLVANLVRFPSTLGHEAPPQRYLASYLERAGLATEVWDLPDDLREVENAGNSGIPFADRPNVSGTLAGAGGGRSLILNGHIDVVSPEPVSAWSRDPWGAEIVGNRLYGRGAYDMKSGVALNAFLPKLVRELGIVLAGDVIVQSVIEEECTGNGALAASLRHRADAAVVTEPTGGAFTLAHVGVVWFRIGIAGVSEHAAMAWRGVNAIVKSVPVIEALQRLDATLNEATHPAFAGVEHPINLNIGVIRGGDWPSTVPGACELHCRLSFYPGVSVAETHAAVEAAVRDAALADPWLREHPPTITWDGFQTAGSTASADEPFLRLLSDCAEEVTGSRPQPRSGTGVNDMRYFNFAGIPSACYGANGQNMHAADEWLDLDTMGPTAKVLGAFMLRWCGVAEG